MQNKEGSHNRPCFYTFSDIQNPDILWCVPISSQVTKFRKIVEHKLEMQKNRGIASPRCNTIRFGMVMGKEKAFLIQNMFPITERYINNVYIDPNTKKPVTIAAGLEKDICKNAQDILKLVFHGHEYLVFADIRKIYAELIAEL